MSIKLIAIDLDGTLLNENHALNPATVTAVKRAKEQGIKVVLCSGRPLTGLQAYLHELNLTEPGDFSISYNGALVQHVDTGKTVVSETLSCADYKRIQDLANELHIHAHVQDEAHIYTMNADISPYTVRESFLVNMPLFYRLPDTFPADKRFAKVMLIDDPAKLAAAKEKIPAAFFDDYYIVNSEPFFLEFMNKAVSKGNAVTALAKYLGYTMDEVMAIGDQANDLPMVEAAGTGVAMGNAIDAVKDAAQVITATNVNDGVAKAITEYALN
ncbi:sugar-phosphatase [Lacticaseibacillus hulanensis]|uniref:sugar-phosphatase n=1 Tax=Lacticaseibacillus hulanensis TaxID=2493111 RepID=UPI000FDC154E|nr:sugar-phosphatase [Lacticaseibacillus hulanensis]